MNVKIVESKASGLEADLLAVLLPSALNSTVLDDVGEATGLAFGELLAEEHFKGDVAKSAVFRGVSGLGARRVVVIGVGTSSDQEAGSYRRAGVTLARVANELRASKVALALDSDAGGRVEEVVTGWSLGCYRYDRHLSNDEERFGGPTDLALAGVSSNSQKDVERALIIAGAINQARDLVNEPPNNLVPEALAQAAKDIASRGGLECKVLGENALHERGFNLIMAVGKGSEHPPRLIHLTYRGKGEAKRKIALVGKGVTFDTGGYNIKPGSSMLNMHCDMAGAAAVLGAARAISELKPEGVEVHFIVPTAENAIANNAFKPMDIFKGYGGKTVEIQNTDAEGRLILADALAFAQEQGADTIIDLATLTGACVVALGEQTAALFSDDDELASGLLDASKRTGEAYWRMPLDKKMDKLLDTPAADMKNVGPRWGGAITAALFLKRWVKLDSWAHLDIAGPAWAEKEDELSGEGGTGFGVSTLVEFVTSL